MKILNIKGKTYQMKLDFAACQAIKAKFGKSILKIGDELVETLQDIETQIDLACYLIALNKDNPSLEVGNLDGDDLAVLATAFLEEYADFFPNQRMRELIQSAIQGIKDTTTNPMSGTMPGSSV